jgi:flavin reductase (DIM6/NTAB) family NADH-FMN oxidoreductase RutF
MDPTRHDPAPAAMTLFPSAELSARDAYRLMTDIIAPRPIAWIGTVGGDGRRNLAPFSYFQALASEPPTIVVSFSTRSDGGAKDSLAHILATREFTVSHVGQQHAELMNASSADYPRDTSEWDALDIAPAASTYVQAPWVAGAAAALECRMTHAIPLGRLARAALGSGGTAPPSATAVIAEVLAFRVRGELLQRDARGNLLPISPAALAAIGRLGGVAYTSTSGAFELPRPTVPAR